MPEVGQKSTARNSSGKKPDDSEPRLPILTQESMFGIRKMRRLTARYVSMLRPSGGIYAGPEDWPRHVTKFLAQDGCHSPEVSANRGVDRFVGIRLLIHICDVFSHGNASAFEAAADLLLLNNSRQPSINQAQGDEGSGARRAARWRNAELLFLSREGHSALMLVAARLRHIAFSKWGKRRYLVTDSLLNPAKQEVAA
jgi:hypothetical protein